MAENVLPQKDVLTKNRKEEARRKEQTFPLLGNVIQSLWHPISVRFVLTHFSFRLLLPSLPYFCSSSHFSLLLSNFLVFCTSEPSYHNFYNSLVCLLFLAHNLPSRIFCSMLLVWERESDIVKFVTFITQTHSTRMGPLWFQGKLGTQTLIVFVCPLSTRIVLLNYGKVYWAEKIQKISKMKRKMEKDEETKTEVERTKSGSWSMNPWLRSFFLSRRQPYNLGNFQPLSLSSFHPSPKWPEKRITISEPGKEGGSASATNGLFDPHI